MTQVFWKFPTDTSILQNIILGTRILEDAEDDFIATAIAIESTKDVVHQQQLAYEFINSHPDYPKVFKFKDLKRELKRVREWQPINCRYAYMLQYSIPLIEKHRIVNFRPYNWIQRLMVFTNTYTVENLVVGHNWKNFKFAFKTRGRRGEINHNELSYGPGEELADYYFWDKPNNKLYASIDLKCSFNSNSIEKVADQYKNKKSRHSARFVLAYLHNEATYYMIEYDDKDTVIDHEKVTDLPLPSDLYDIYNI